MESSQASGQLTPKRGEQQAQPDVTSLSLPKKEEKRTHLQEITGFYMALPRAAAWQLRARPHIPYNKPHLLKPNFRDLSSTFIYTVLESSAAGGSNFYKFPQELAGFWAGKYSPHRVLKSSFAEDRNFSSSRVAFMARHCSPGYTFLLLVSHVYSHVYWDNVLIFTIGWTLYTEPQLLISQGSITDYFYAKCHEFSYETSKNCWNVSKLIVLRADVPDLIEAGAYVTSGLPCREGMTVCDKLQSRVIEWLWWVPSTQSVSTHQRVPELQVYHADSGETTPPMKLSMKPIRESK
ncbi:hypothetical protein DUI87_07403 [Hirundo rustica rustica]|uniref:Uncharacterized protein n=1 Tax=Hirundo rustica rustica TaxID=333673 RepID=A0A3M0KPN9_HIRRU|nr:hypothetical protein DUI87_07403 [Hirundo rustica rustica]